LPPAEEGTHEPEIVTFHSAGERIEALFFRAQGTAEAAPAVVLAGGWCYVKEIVQQTYARAFARAGLHALLFDYRRLGASGGEPRQHLDPHDQIEDYKNALSYLESREDVDARRLGAWGISYSGGHVLILGAVDPRVRSVASIVPVIDGYANMQRAHGTLGFRRLKQTIRDARRRLYETGEHSYIPHGAEDPLTEVCTWPFGANHSLFAWLKETQGPRYENRATVASTEMLMEYTVMPYVARLTDVPALMVVAEGDDHTMWELEVEAFNQIATPRKRLVVVPRSGHHSLYRDGELIDKAASECSEWFAEHLV
jgi:alpha-beta hydrolase superfamily lysophospholipase